MKINGQDFDPGQAVLVYGTLVWVAVAVGPAWVAAALFAAACLTNVGVYAMIRYLERRRAYSRRTFLSGHGGFWAMPVALTVTLAGCSTAMRRPPETLEAVCARPENAQKPLCRDTSKERSDGQ